MYRETQVAWPILILTTLMLLLVTYLAFRQGELLILIIAVPVFTAIEMLFATLTVEVDKQYLSLRFGVGLLRRRVDLKSIRRFAAVTPPWYYGWGIRVTRDGMLYNAAARSAVELLLDDGRRIAVGTRNPEALIKALESITRLSRSSSTADFPQDEAWRRRNRLLAGIMVAIAIAWTLVNVYLNRQ